jgi:hypothetical protein
MAGVYTVTLTVKALKYDANATEMMLMPKMEIRSVSPNYPASGSSSNLTIMQAQDNDILHDSIQRTFITSVTVRMTKDNEFQMVWPSSFTLQGQNNSNNGGWMSITKISN